MDELIQMLQDKRSPKRRTAAKRLRKLGNTEAGAALLDALENELEDKRTWETQYQMIMAIGECVYIPALPRLKILQKQNFEATMVYVAIGDAIVRLSANSKTDVTSVLEILELSNTMLSDGALRAMAMLRLLPDEKEIKKIIQYVQTNGVNEGINIWVLAAAPGWAGEDVESYLKYCEQSESEVVTKAVVLARTNKYKKWNPL